jgi:hypothetical protein
MRPKVGRALTTGQYQGRTKSKWRAQAKRPASNPVSRAIRRADPRDRGGGDTHCAGCVHRAISIVVITSRPLPTKARRAPRCTGPLSRAGFGGLSGRCAGERLAMELRSGGAFVTRQQNSTSATRVDQSGHSHLFDTIPVLSAASVGFQQNVNNRGNPTQSVFGWIMHQCIINAPNRRGEDETNFRGPGCHVGGSA